MGKILKITMGGSKALKVGKICFQKILGSESVSVLQNVSEDWIKKHTFCWETIQANSCF